MLIKRLNLPGYQFLNDVIYAICGLLSSILSIIKLIFMKPALI